jgi:uncharacterized Tic20 family protein
MNAYLPRLPLLRDERDWAAAPHSLFGLCLIAGTFAGYWGGLFFLTSLIGTGWLALRTRHTKVFAYRQARQSLNLQLSLLVVYVVAYTVNQLRPEPDNPPLLVVIVLGSFVGALAQTWIASTRAAKGVEYRMPFAIPFLH